MISESQLDWLRLVLVPELGPARIEKLLAKFASPAAIFAASATQLQSTGLEPDICKHFHPPNSKQLDHAVEWLNSSETHYLLTLDDRRYPILLKDIHHPPPVLFVKGDVSLLSQLQLAMVGSRNPTPQGQENAYEFARYLANTGLTITSGLAMGIDGASHTGALDGGGKTIAVTGNGLDRVYPAKHRELAHRIAEQGALISEYPPGTKPLPANFPRRNRIISGLSLGTLVVEAAVKSGSLITAYKALEQSREVFAIPGSIHNPLARGCHQLIRQGGKLVETARDVLEELAPLAQAALTLGEPSSQPSESSHENNESHQAILDAMAYDPVTIDLLIQRTEMNASEISSILLILELEGKISSQAGGNYVRNGQA